MFIYKLKISKAYLNWWLGEVTTLALIAEIHRLFPKWYIATRFLCKKLAANEIPGKV